MKTTWARVGVSVAAAVLGGCLATSAVAAGSSGQQGVGKMNIRPDGTLMVWGATGDWSNPDACTDSSSVVMDVSAPGYKERYAMLLAAMLEGRQIVFYLSGCQTIGTSTYPRMGSVTIL